MEKRHSQRFDKMFPVAVTSAIFGEFQAVARNISSGGMFLETSDPLPLGSTVRVHFPSLDSDGEIVARGEIRGHYFLNFADETGPRRLTGMGLRFLSFEDDGDQALDRSLSRLRRRPTLH